jgi:membrane-bound ClpP family serine protease
MDIWVALVLVIFGLIFLVLEVFIFPGVGISGIVGFIALTAGVVMAFMLDTHLGVYMLIGAAVGSSILAYLAVKFDTFSLMALKRQIDSKVEVNHLKDLKLNDLGTTISRLAPMGKAQFGAFMVEVSSYDGFIDENSPIKIEKIKDNTIFVTHVN